ncbi:hypothetical protein ACFLTD_04990, partial [Elusimicrobiota bacterium]
MKNNKSFSTKENLLSIFITAIGVFLVAEAYREQFVSPAQEGTALLAAAGMPIMLAGIFLYIKSIYRLFKYKAQLQGKLTLPAMLIICGISLALSCAAAVFIYEAST